jgi:hypothetical protein
MVDIKSVNIGEKSFRFIYISSLEILYGFIWDYVLLSAV